MTLSDLEWPFHASRAISAVAELLELWHIIIIIMEIVLEAHNECKKIKNTKTTQNKDTNKLG